MGKESVKLRRGERVATVTRAGKATAAGVVKIMAGVKPGRGVFVAVPNKPNPIKTRKRAKPVPA